MAAINLIEERFHAADWAWRPRKSAINILRRYPIHCNKKDIPMNKPLDLNNTDRPTPLPLAELRSSLWSTRMKIRFGHCDPAGIVYTPNFFDIFNVVIEKWYEHALGIDYYKIIGTRRVGLGYVNAHADFFSPCTMGNMLDIVVDLERVGNTSFVVLLHAFQSECEALRGRFTVVTTDLSSHRPAPIPEDLRTALLVYAKS